MKGFKELESVVIKIRDREEEMSYPQCDWDERDNFILIWEDKRREHLILAAATDKVEYIYYKYELIPDYEKENK